MTSSARRVPKQDRSRRRYDEILDAAANVFAKEGLEAATTNEIADSAGMSIGSLYQYFDDKEAIIAALWDRYVEMINDITSDFLAAEVVEWPVQKAVDRVMDPVITFHTRHAAFSRLWIGADLSAGRKKSIRSVDAAVLGRLETLLTLRMRGMRRERARLIATTAQSALKSLLALLIRSDDPRYQKGVTREVKRMIVEYMKALIREHDEKMGKR